MSDFSKPKFAICIPTLNRLDLLLPALLYYSVNMPNVDIFILDNGKQDILSVITNSWGGRYNSLYTNVLVNNSPKNVGVAASWNELLAVTFNNEYTHALVLNDDVFLNRTEVEISSLIENPDYQNCFFVCQEDFDFSCFIISKEIFEKVGKFDENFYPAYYEDMDYLYRMHLSGVEVHNVPFLNPSVFNRSKTLEKAPELLNGFAEKNLEYYKGKWGGLPMNEVFTEPFNDSKK